MPEIKHLVTGFHVNTDQGALALCTIVLIQGEKNYLVDVGFKGRADLLKTSLEGLGLGVGDIDAIILTHSHWDHSQNTDVFPDAQIMIHPKELEYAEAPKKGDYATPRYFINTLQGRDVKEIVEGQEIEPGITVLDTPGHTRGHVSVMVDTSCGKIAVAGDALPMATSVFTKEPMIAFWDKKEAADSINKLIDSTKVFYPGHDRAFEIKPGDVIEYFSGDEYITLADPPPGNRRREDQGGPRRSAASQGPGRGVGAATKVVSDCPLSHWERVGVRAARTLVEALDTGFRR